MAGVRVMSRDMQPTAELRVPTPWTVLAWKVLNGGAEEAREAARELAVLILAGEHGARPVE